MDNKVPKLVGCINVYNEERSLGNALFYMHELFDRFVIADGAYLSRGEVARSTDRTLNIIRKYQKDGPMALLNKEGRKAWIEKEGVGSYKALLRRYPPRPVKLIKAQGFWPSEVHKRNRMLMELEEGDWYFYLDADWKPIFKHKLPETRAMILDLPDEVDNLWIQIAKGYGKYIEDGRVKIPVAEYPDFGAFRKRHGVHFVYNHVTLADENGTFVWNRPDWTRERVGIVYEEIVRPNWEGLIEDKRKMFHKGFHVELGNGAGRYVCAGCGHGAKIMKAKDPTEIAGFVVPRGFPLSCPKCGSGDLENPSFIGKWGPQSNLKVHGGKG